MSTEGAIKNEQLLRIYGRELKMFLANKDYARAKPVFKVMQNMTKGAKVRVLLIIMMKVGVDGNGRRGIHHIQKRALKLTEETLKTIAYHQRLNVLTNAFGFVGKRFMGPLGVAMLFNDLVDGGLVIADSMVEQMILNRMALYGDYLDEREEYLQVAQVKEYDEWLASNYLPALHQKNSQFFQELRRVFPDGFPGFA